MEDPRSCCVRLPGPCQWLPWQDVAPKDAKTISPPAPAALATTPVRPMIHRSIAEVAEKQSMSTPPASPPPAPAALKSEVVIMQKNELESKLGITLVHRSEADDHPVVLSIANGCAAATPANHISGVLMPGDRVVSISGAGNVLRTNWSHNCVAAANETVSMLKKSKSSIVNVRIEREGVESVIQVERASSEASLGLQIESNTKWLHPVVRMVEQGPCEGKIKVGDHIVSVEAATTQEKRETRNTMDDIKASVAFLDELVGPVKFQVLRIPNLAQREAFVTHMVAEATGEELVAGKSRPTIMTVAMMKLWRQKSVTQKAKNWLDL